MSSHDSAEFPEASVTVSFNDLEVVVTRPNGKIEKVEWADLKAVILSNNDKGPFFTDIYWILVGSQSGCVVPTGANGERELLERLQKLPGFDNEAVIASMSCTENKDFLCWKREE